MEYIVAPVFSQDSGVPCTWLLEIGLGLVRHIVFRVLNREYELTALTCLLLLNVFDSLSLSL